MIKAYLGDDFDKFVQRLFPFVKRTSLSPTVLTLCGVGCAVLAGTAFAMGWILLGGVLMGFAGFFDVIDGAVARAQATESAAGAFLDSSMDRLSDLFVLGGIGVGAAARADFAGVALVFWALSGSVMTSYLRARAEVYLEGFQVGIMERGERWFVLTVGALTGYVAPALWVVAIGSTITSVQRLVVGHREIARLSEPFCNRRPKSSRRMKHHG